MKELPSNVKIYNRSDVFTEETIPERLLSNHQTKADCWVTVTVQEGTLLFFTEGSDEPVRLTPERGGVIEPEIVHHVKPDGKVKFFLEFYQEGRRRH